MQMIEPRLFVYAIPDLEEEQEILGAKAEFVLPAGEIETMLRRNDPCCVLADVTLSLRAGQETVKTDRRRILAWRPEDPLALLQRTRIEGRQGRSHDVGELLQRLLRRFSEGDNHIDALQSGSSQMLWFQRNHHQAGDLLRQNDGRRVEQCGNQVVRFVDDKPVRVSNRGPHLLNARKQLIEK